MLSLDEGSAAMAAAAGLSDLVLDAAFDRRRDNLVSTGNGSEFMATLVAVRFVAVLACHFGDINLKLKCT